MGDIVMNLGKLKLEIYPCYDTNTDAKTYCPFFLVYLCSTM